MESGETFYHKICYFFRTNRANKIKTSFRKLTDCNFLYLMYDKTGLQPVSRPVEQNLGFFPKDLKRCKKRHRQTCYQTFGNRIGQIWPNFYVFFCYSCVLYKTSNQAVTQENPKIPAKFFYVSTDLHFFKFQNKTFNNPILSLRSISRFYSMKYQRNW